MEHLLIICMFRKWTESHTDQVINNQKCGNEPVRRWSLNAIYRWVPQPKHTLRGAAEFPSGCPVCCRWTAHCPGMRTWVQDSPPTGISIPGPAANLSPADLASAPFFLLPLGFPPLLVHGNCLCRLQVLAEPYMWMYSLNSADTGLLLLMSDIVRGLWTLSSMPGNWTLRSTHPQEISSTPNLDTVVIHPTSP